MVLKGHSTFFFSLLFITPESTKQTSEKYIRYCRIKLNKYRIQTDNSIGFSTCPIHNVRTSENRWRSAVNRACLPLIADVMYRIMFTGASPLFMLYILIFMYSSQVNIIRYITSTISGRQALFTADLHLFSDVRTLWIVQVENSIELSVCIRYLFHFIRQYRIF